MSSLLSPLCRAITPRFYLVSYLNSLYQGCPFVHSVPFVFNDNLYESFFPRPLNCERGFTFVTPAGTRFNDSCDLA